MSQILVGYPLNRFEELEKIFKSFPKNYSFAFRDYNRSWLIDNISKFDILIPSLKVLIDDAILERGKSLRYLFTPTTGTDHLVFNRNKFPIPVFSLRDYPESLEMISATAELGFGFMLHLSRKIVLAHHEVVQKKKWERNNFIGHELSGKKLGIVGLGRIGKKIANYANAFGMKVLYWDLEKRAGYEKAKSLEDLLQRSDFILLAVPLTDETVYLINQKNVTQMKRGSFLINISRGKVVEEKALCEALDTEILQGVATDVLEKELEDFKESPLFQYVQKNPEANVIITPHVGGATVEAWEKVFSLVGQKILKEEALCQLN